MSKNEYGENEDLEDVENIVSDDDNIIEEPLEKPKPKPKVKRVATEKQLAALAKGRSNLQLKKQQRLENEAKLLKEKEEFIVKKTETEKQKLERKRLRREELLKELEDDSSDEEIIEKAAKTVKKVKAKKASTPVIVNNYIETPQPKPAAKPRPTAVFI
jgi:hypothetical protein